MKGKLIPLPSKKIIGKAERLISKIVKDTAQLLIDMDTMTPEQALASELRIKDFEKQLDKLLKKVDILELFQETKQ